MKSMNVARKFYPRLRYIRINISTLLATLLQVAALQSTLVQSGTLPVLAASLLGYAGAAQAAVTSSGNVSSSGGVEHVNSDGLATSATLTAGGVQQVNSGGQANDTQVLSGGRQNIIGGGANGTHISSGGAQHISGPGGYVLFTVISSGGAQHVSSGAVISVTTILSGGAQHISNGGIAKAAAISGGVQEVGSGASTYSTPIYSGGVQNISSGGSGEQTFIYSGGVQNVQSGGNASKTAIENGGTQNLNGGRESETTVSSGGQQNVNNGGVASAVDLQRDGIQSVNSGGVASSTKVAGHQVLSGGTAVNAQVLSGGSQTVSNGGHASGTIVSSGANQSISSGGVASNTEVSSGSQQTINSGGVTSDSKVAGHQILSGGGSAVNDKILSGGSQTVNSGAYASGTTVSSGGEQIVGDGDIIDRGAGGVVSAVDLKSGGKQTIHSGGIAVDTKISGHQILNGGTALNNQIMSGGSQTVSAAGYASSTTISSGGQLNVNGNGVADGTHVKSGGQLNLAPWAVISNTHLSSGVSQSLVLDHVAHATVVSSGASLLVSSGAVTSQTHVAGGGEHVSAGGRASDTHVSSGGEQHVSGGGTVSNTHLSSGGAQHLREGQATGTIVSNGGQQHVSNGGMASNAMLSHGGQQYVSSGGTANNTQVSNGASQHVSDGGVVSGTIVNDGGKVYVSSGGSSYATVINNGGHEYIQSGGYGPNATINSGGQQTISTGGLDEDSTINSGGRQHVYGEARRAQIAGGTQLVYSGGLATSGTMMDNGRIEVSAGGTLTDTIISGGSNTININGGTLDGQLKITSGGKGNIVNLVNASLKAIDIRDEAGESTLNISGTSFSAANAGSAGLVGISNWKTLSLNDKAKMTLAGDMALASASQLLINGTAYLNQSANDLTLTTGQLINAGTITILNGQTLNLIGNYTQTSSGILELGLGSLGDSGKFNITGSATLQAGAKVVLQQSTPDLVANARYNNILTASQGISGSMVDGVYRGRQFKLERNGTGIDLIALDLVQSKAAANNPVLTSLLGGGQAQAALDQSQSNLGIIRERMQRMNGSAYFGTDASNQIWFTSSPYGHVGHRSHRAGYPGSGYDQRGVAMAFGVDKALNSERRVGAAIILGGSKIEGHERSTNNQINNTGVEVAVYGSEKLRDDLSLSLIAKTGYTRARSSRIETLELPVSAKSRQDIFSLNLAAELVKDIAGEQLMISPLLSVEYGSAWVNGYKESGSGYYDLNVKRQRAESLIASVGSRMRYQLNKNAYLLGVASVGYDALARNSHLTARNTGSSFVVESADPGNIVGRLGLAYEYLAAGSSLFRVGYDYMGRDKGYNDNMIRLEWVWQQ